MLNKDINFILRRKGYKLTPQRRAIIHAIRVAREHFSPLQIHKEVSSINPEIGLVTIYRTLKVLRELGLVCEVFSKGKNRTYIVSGSSHHHHHLVCSGCGAVIDFKECNLTNLESTLAERTGFRIDEHRLDFYGKCRECNEKPSPV